MKVKKINMYRVPMTRTEGAYAYVKATSKKEAQEKFNSDNIDHTEFDSDINPGITFEQDGPIELYDDDIG